MKNFVLLLQFFTRIPIKKNYQYDNESYGKNTYLLPLVGLIIGLFIYFSDFLLKYLVLPKEIHGLLLIFLWIILTGALHLDGLADTVDGIFSYRPKEKILEIMRDPHIGTNGVISLILIIIFKFYLYTNSDISIIFLSFIVGRLTIIMSASFGNYARNKGMALAIIEYNNRFSFIKSLIITLIIFSFWRKNMFFLFLTLGLSFFIHKKVIKKIGGITGDTLGFLCEISEVIFIFFTIIL